MLSTMLAVVGCVAAPNSSFTGANVAGPVVLPGTTGQPGASSAPGQATQPGAPAQNLTPLVNTADVPGAGKHPCGEILGGLQDFIDTTSTSSKAAAFKSWVNSAEFEQFMRKAANNRRDQGKTLDQSSSAAEADVSYLFYGAGGYYQDNELRIRTWDRSGASSSMSLSEFRSHFNSEQSSSLTEEAAESTVKRIANSEVVAAWRECIRTTNPGGGKGLTHEISANGAQVVLEAKYTPVGDPTVDAAPTITGVVISPNIVADGDTFGVGKKVTIAGVIGSFTRIKDGAVSIIIQTDKGAIRAQLGGVVAPIFSPVVTTAPVLEKSKEPSTPPSPKCPEGFESKVVDGAAVCLPTPTPKPSPVAASFAVSATTSTFQDTGVFVREGQTVTLTSKGLTDVHVGKGGRTWGINSPDASKYIYPAWTPGSPDWNWPLYDADGDQRSQVEMGRPGTFIAPTLRAFCLLGKIGGSETFFVGKSSVFRSKYSGNISLIINDSGFTDNACSIITTILVQ
jgi:hypothetical protein